ncbi:MAG TPA: glycosyltransferase family 2 protein [Acidimicrobiales bacterium]|nr:glycosyltransferase family 2 protein [Acidimicrobiales bacterium]
MDAAPTAPPVVAVVVTHDPGPWLEECLAALAAQDYPSLSVLVVDAASAEDPTPRVASVLPTAYVRRITGNPGFGPAANEVLQVVEGASHFLFCHDDVAPAPDTVRLLLEEAFRSNAGIVAPKLVDWDEPEHLLQVGMGADKSGAPVPAVEHGELDQEQHDAVRDVFVAPGGCTLVRADLFAALGGFDPKVSFFGEDLDLSWRAQIAGARVVVAPGARVRHRESMSRGERAVGDVVPADNAALRAAVRPLQLRHRLRAVLKDYGLFHLLRVLPQILLLGLAEMAYGLVSGRRQTTKDIAGAWRWNLRQWGDLRAARKAVRKNRSLGDGEVRRLQSRGSARMNAFVRGQLAGEDRARLAHFAGPDAGSTLQTLRLPLIVWGVVAAVLLVGTRRLLNGPLPAVGELAPFPEHVLDVIRPFLSGWHATGLGSEGPAPAALGLLGLGGTVLLDGMGLLQKVLVLGALPAGAIGMFRLAKPLGSMRTRLAALVVYVAIPLPYNALARGRWGALLLYAAGPWLIGSLLRATGLEPFAGGRATETGARRWIPLLCPGLLLALVAAFAPAVALLFVVVAVGLLLGSLLAGEVKAASRAVVLAVGAVVVAVVLLFPWSLGFVLPGARWSAVSSVGLGIHRGLGVGPLLRFQTGPLGAPPLGWAFLVVAALPLVLGREWRFAWAARLWTVALLCWGVAWAGGRHWLGVAVPSADLLLMPADLALALCAGLGMAAFETDLRGYRLGWRQVALVVSAGAAALGTLPVLGASVDGRWKLPGTDFHRSLAWMQDHRHEGAFRVLWVGDPEALPLDGWRLEDGVAYATSRGGAPDIADRWPDPNPGTSVLLGDMLDVARRGDTTRLGHLLAPMGVRYVVVPSALAPNPASRRPRVLPPAPDVPAALAAQLDLRQVATDPTLTIYENAAWAPGRAVLTSEPAVAASKRGSDRAALSVDLAGSPPALVKEHSDTSFSGIVPEGGTVHVAEAYSPGWSLRSGGSGAERRHAFGWATAFDGARGGSGSLRYHTNPVRWLAILIELALWVALVRFLVRERRAR